MLSEWWVRRNFWSIRLVNSLSSHCLHMCVDLLDLNVLLPGCCHLPVGHTYYVPLCYVCAYVGYVICMHACV